MPCIVQKTQEEIKFAQFRISIAILVENRRERGGKSAAFGGFSTKHESIFNLIVYNKETYMDKQKNSVLIVDDEAMNITALSYMLSQEYTIYVEKDGEGAIDTAQKLQPDLILLDIIMPEMSGFDVISKLKEDSRTKDIPVIFITSLNETEDEEKGLICGAADYITKPFNKSTVAVRVRSQMRIVNQMRLINNISITDPLTNVGNRRYFNTILEQEWKRAVRQKSSIALLIIDVDFFKQYNDTYGHIEGDRVLKNVAQSIKGVLARVTDKLARWGGEEFAVILPDTEQDGAIKVAEDIRKCVEGTEIELDCGTTASITISIGVNATVPTRTCNLDEFISNTDDALYEAKKTGRNKVCVTDTK